MTRSYKKNTFQVALNVPAELLEELDEAAKALKMNRTETILRSLRRDLRNALREETKRAMEYQMAMEKEFGA